MNQRDLLNQVQPTFTRDSIPGLYDSLDPEWLEFRDEQFEHIQNRLILSLFDHTGAWAQPYRDAGYPVYQFDLDPQGFGWADDIADFNVEHLTADLDISLVYGILAAPPCTMFTSSCNRTWADKDADGRTAAALHLVNQAIRTVELFSPVFWALENPVGRMNKLAGLGPGYFFQPYDFGDPYPKKTGIWGRFNDNLVRNPVEPTDNRIMTVGGDTAATKAFRSITPPGFAQAFFEANS